MTTVTESRFTPEIERIMSARRALDATARALIDEGYVAIDVIESLVGVATILSHEESMRQRERKMNDPARLRTIKEQNEAEAEAKRRWGDAGIISVHGNVYKVGVYEDGEFTFFGEGDSWSEAFSAADRFLREVDANH